MKPFAFSQALATSLSAFLSTETCLYRSASTEVVILADTASSADCTAALSVLASQSLRMIGAMASAGWVFLSSWSTTQPFRSEEHTFELQSLRHLVCRLLLENKK